MTEKERKMNDRIDSLIRKLAVAREQLKREKSKKPRKKDSFDPDKPSSLYGGVSYNEYVAKVQALYPYGVGGLQMETSNGIWKFEGYCNRPGHHPTCTCNGY